ncbi:hypothetical protein [Flagellimonas abyssi]|uniref:Novel STAND NTPase 3 domain-containing protein n=1 Tax=Flagellimonas abyssi TaxID=2864871 RepID=A0ABS7EVN7_9FLAO|nr:hypothetical protein [Allomuricauda abyssi]MBW8201596.1 hypothetical protein [Allomuricauda abyssi]
MSRLQNVENALATINGAVFQELCDSFLILQNNNYMAFSRSGSQLGNQKTIKGTPDTFLLLPNGKYIFVEYSTNKTSGLSKLIKDVEKCLDSDTTGIEVSLISEIILCLNFKLKPFEIESLKSKLVNTRVALNIYTLDRLALEISLQHRDLAHKYLQIPLDTGQIVSIEQFIDEYGRAANGIATPINNTFLHRKDEVDRLKKFLALSNFIILTGAPGVGKTKLAIEGIKEFINENESFKAYCISYKNHTLLDDLYQYFDTEKNYILFVDDANRIDAFNQILGFFKSRRNGHFKIVVTVRDYAFNQIDRLSQEFNPIRIDINKFTDEQITDIIEAEPYGILNPDYQKEILRIAEGNPRIAIMSALLAKDKQNITVLSDVSDLFEKYFSTFIKDDGQFSNNLNLRCLGIISFFHTLPFKDKEITSNILSNFEIGYNDFIEVIDELDKLEIVEIQYEHIKIPEQNLATYFFYRSFIKDDLLSFDVLLKHYFFSNPYRFRDTVIPANNTFGPDRVMDKLKPHLQTFWNIEDLKNSNSNAIKFLNTFWFYLRDETFEYVLNSVKLIEYPVVEKYVVTYSNNEFSHSKNEIIELVGNFFNYTTNLKEAIELAFYYTRKKPEHLSELIHKIVGTLTFDRNDYQTRYFRQTTLFDIIYDGFLTDAYYYSSIFFELCKTFLAYSFHHFKSDRNHSFYMYDYPLENSIEIRSFRAKIWTTLKDQFENYPKLAFDTLKSLKNSPRDIDKDLKTFDLDYLISIIEEKLRADSFEHAKYVQNEIIWLKKSGISHPKFAELKASFTNEIYRTYLKIDWDRYRDKELYEFADFREYERLKEREIRESFVFEDFNEVNSFYKIYCLIRRTVQNDWNYSRVLDLIIDENFKHDFEIGKYMLGTIISEDQINYIPNLPFRNQLNSTSKADILWDLIQQQNFNNKTFWALSFFDGLDDGIISRKHLNLYLETLNNTKNAYLTHFEKIARFQKIEPNIFEIILIHVVEQNDSGGDLKIWRDFFDEHFEKLGSNIELIKKAYIQQDFLQHHFDYEGKGFLKILKSDVNFLLEYVKEVASKGRLSFSRENRQFGFIWQINEIEEVLSGVFDFCVEAEHYYGILNHYCNAFFDGLLDKHKDTAEKFLLNYARENNGDAKRVNVVVDIARSSMKGIFNDILIQHIKLNPEVNVFSNVWWRGNGGTYSGDVIIGDIEATDWRNILEIIEKSDLGFESIPIKNQVKRNIEYALKSADRERKRRFLERNY